MGMLAKLQGQAFFHLVSEQFRLEGEGDKQEIICIACGVPAAPDIP
jgi:hypothetical protein